MASACGAPDARGGWALPDSSAGLQAAAASASPGALLALAREEKTAVELARAAQQRAGLDRTFRDYVLIQERLHVELLTQLVPADAQGGLAMSDAGVAMLAALEGLDGAALAARYYAVQRPWQRSVLQQLRESALPEAYQLAALQRWGRDLAALEALDR